MTLTGKKCEGTGAVDMTTGPVLRHILAFGLPMLLGYLFQQFYSMVDTIIVGKFVGVYALAGVGSTGAINFMIIGFCMGLCSGFAIPIAQSFGAHNLHHLRKYVANSLWTSAIFALVVTVLVCALTHHILSWMNTEADIYDYAYDYIFIVFAGIPATILYNLASSIIRSLGDSRTPVYFLLFSSVLNIALDLLSIIVLGMGVKGAAIATVFSQLISGIGCMLYMYRKFPFIRGNRTELRFYPRYSLRLVGVGVPMGLQFTITAIGNVMLQTAVNGLGYQSVAAIAAGNKINLFFNTPFDSLGGTMATFAGQNAGAHKFERVKQSLKVATLLGFGYTLIACCIMIFFGDSLARLFLDQSEHEIIQMTHFFLVAEMSFGMLLTCVNVYRLTMQGMGFSRLAMFAGFLEMLGRSLIAFVFVPMFGFWAACFASPIAWLFASFFLVPTCLACVQKLKRAHAG